MSLFSPRRYQAPFKPYKREESTPIRLFTSFEQGVKSALFGCRMCGNCILQETAFVCPMTCPKGLRNGLCGGATPERCEVDPSRPCTWYVIYDRAERLGREDRLLEINAPLDGARVGRETWLDVIDIWRTQEERLNLLDLVRDRETFSEKWDELFYAARQPDWWQGDSAYHPPAYSAPLSRLEANLRTGVFTTTAEIAPPLDASFAVADKKISWLHDYVSAANFTDSASATPRMSSLAASVRSRQEGLEPVMQLQARDRSRVALE
ncbi:MAG TPA: methylenetetrahydrofolate reductase C-terminal domain-containing protein, partial [Anaerolineae bacterium]|nr:methylenetetrahydrofolate reductase C-terminal domain-containing protein [Anaerolineae bacterium]